MESEDVGVAKGQHVTFSFAFLEEGMCVPF